jgi:two-component system LytT family sensor kinase
MSARWIRLCVITAYWTLDGLAFALGPLAELDHKFFAQLVSCLLWIPYTMLALELTARFPVERDHLARRLALHAAAAAIVVVTRPMLFVATERWFAWGSVNNFGQLMVTSLRFNLFQYVLIVGAAQAVYFAMRARDRERHAERLEVQLTGARLAALRSQLQPHFLFNALGGIAELVHRDPHAADRMLVRLSRMLRIALDDSDAHVVTLAYELSCLEPYLELEKMRYGDRLTVVMEIEPAARESCVPGLLLQPVVENAIRHGIAPRTAPGTVTIRARLVHPNVQLEIEDDGVGLASELAVGIGLRNTRARLAELYGDASELEIHGRPGGGARVRIRVPQGVAT